MSKIGDAYKKYIQGNAAKRTETWTSQLLDEIKKELESCSMFWNLVTAKKEQSKIYPWTFRFTFNLGSNVNPIHGIPNRFLLIFDIGKRTPEIWPTKNECSFDCSFYAGLYEQKENVLMTLQEVEINQLDLLYKNLGETLAIQYYMEPE